MNKQKEGEASTMLYKIKVKLEPKTEKLNKMKQ